MKITMEMRDALAKVYGEKARTCNDDEAKKLLAQMLQSKTKAQEGISKGINALKTKPKSKTSAAKMFGGAFVLEPSARYSSKKYVAKNKHGQEATYKGKVAEMPSEKELAMTGVFIKQLAIKSGMAQYSGIVLRDHEKALLAEMQAAQGAWLEFEPSNEKSWCDLAPKNRVKALLDDTTSGGQYTNPIWYDQNIILPALLNGELFPNVDVVEQPRGRTINTARVGIPTVTWGTAEGTALTPFTTTGLISQIDATSFSVAVAMEIGRDLMADAMPVDIGSAVQTQIGQRMQAELDLVIASGDGVTQPQGIFGASGTTGINSDNSTPGPLTVSDAENLIFGVAKQYRQAPYRPFFLSNDTGYRRFRSIPVGPLDERRVFGQGMMGTDDSQRYQLFEYAYRVQNDLTNGKFAFLPGQAYRLWRRQGWETLFTNQGNYLSLRNLGLLVVRGRFAGKIVLPDAVATMTDGQS